MKKKMKFVISGTHCPACKRLIEGRVEQIEGIVSIDVNFESGNTQIVAIREILKDEIQGVLKDMEYVVK